MAEIVDLNGDVVVTLAGPSLQDIPALARNFADRAEAGEYGPLRCVVVIALGQDGEITPFGWGDTDEMHTLGTLSAALVWMGSRRTSRG